MFDAFGEILNGFEESLVHGVDVLLKAGVPKEWAEIIYELAKNYIVLPEVKISGVLQLTSTAPDGMLKIRDVLIKAKEHVNGMKVNCKIYSAGSPRYRVDVTAKDYHSAEKALSLIVDSALKGIKSVGGSGSFTRL